jgi:transposase
MTDRTPSSLPLTTLGIDISDRKSHVCVLNADGEVVRETTISTTQTGFSKFLAGYAGARVVYEVGTHSPWITRVVDSCGCESIVANPRKLSLISRSTKKNDRSDAESLARLGRVDPKLLSPIKHRSPQAQTDRALLRLRVGLVGCRSKLINELRGIVKSHGSRLPSCSGASFHRKVVDAIPEELRNAAQPILEVIAHLTAQIRNYDREIEDLGELRYPETQKLQKVVGVGPMTSLAFALCIEDPSRFQRSRDVGAYLGLVPRQFESGKSSPQLRITKTGDRDMRRLLVQCAQYILGHWGEDCDLRRSGQAIAERGGRNAKRRAVVAVARKLAVLLHRLWVSDTPYDPNYKATRKALRQSA